MMVVGGWVCEVWPTLNLTPIMNQGRYFTTTPHCAAHFGSRPREETEAGSNYTHIDIHTHTHALITEHQKHRAVRPVPSVILQRVWLILIWCQG